ncbi:MAG: helix-turn-helix domain-containing protein [Clostridiales Family XIII bacterium]|jgi:transposase|nr:helix-turn-helix domain-containing protein [Clostridiales Family XIII bacterium]
MNKAYKFGLHPNKSKEKLLGKTFSCVRFIYNHMPARITEMKGGARIRNNRITVSSSR